jgi:hypothetical protein
MIDDRALILAAVQAYLDGLHEADTEKLAGVFHPGSCLTYAEKGALVPLARDRWLDALSSSPSAKERGLARYEEILSLDIASPTTAVVKLKCAIPPRFFTDYLCFLKANGRWRVAQKVFSIEMRMPDATG